MPDATFNFPRGFLWGAATSSHQVEGNNTNNNWHRWEHSEGKIHSGHLSGLANDWWGGRWREDFDRAAESGQNAHRLSIEWSRVQPAPDRWDQNALDHYREMLRGLNERGMTPLVTLHHFTDPLWLEDHGGWTNPDVVTFFEAYAEQVVTALKGLCTTWCTINEPNVVTSLGYLLGTHPPGKKDIGQAFTVMGNQVLAHAAAYRKIHELQPEARVGPVINYRSLQPRRGWSPLDRMATWMQRKLYNDFFVDAVQTGKMDYLYKSVRAPEAIGTMDFLGINYYTRQEIFFDPGAANTAYTYQRFRTDAEMSQNGFMANEPEGFFEALKWGYRCGVPLIVTENGIEDEVDGLRPRYLAQHLHQLWRAVNFNYRIKGYFHWTLVDNFEWDAGWKLRFGLYELDPETQARRKRRSAGLYEAVCKTNSLSSAMVREFAPEVFEKIFPG
ncbi:MAG: glycoside hydrolase family 1 protein [Anaerolineae bacterium]|nr:MAG: glycoside hydrolase family 1 protein [Anaerolineae bacterium]